ncbi:hypothetical protein C8R45DRAFT_946371 [Mycena sanguinolenta]|nr:hypothetical protein C8R45DRAFT_946371 [Mycena sanguinolenta]
MCRFFVELKDVSRCRLSYILGYIIAVVSRNAAVILMFVAATWKNLKGAVSSNATGHGKLSFRPVQRNLSTPVRGKRASFWGERYEIIGQILSGQRNQFIGDGRGPEAGERRSESSLIQHASENENSLLKPFNQEEEESYLVLKCMRFMKWHMDAHGTTKMVGYETFPWLLHVCMWGTGPSSDVEMGIPTVWVAGLQSDDNGKYARDAAGGSETTDTTKAVPSCILDEMRRREAQSGYGWAAC